MLPSICLRLLGWGVAVGVLWWVSQGVSAFAPCLLLPVASLTPFLLLTLFVFVCLPVIVSVHLSVRLSVSACQSACQSLCLSVFLLVSCLLFSCFLLLLLLCLSVFVFMRLPVSQSWCMSVSLSGRLAVCQSVSMSVSLCQSVFKSRRPSFLLCMPCL